MFFKNFRSIFLEQCGMDPDRYYTSPGLSCDSLLKKTGVQLELLTEVGMHLFIEKGTRGGISMVCKRYAKANNPHVKDYGRNNPNNYIRYLDANNLYDWAMSKPLPKRKFAWKTVIPTEEQILAKREKAKRGWILVVNLDYPVVLHKAHNGYPLTSPKERK